jgi:hypothetical protein
MALMVSPIVGKETTGDTPKKMMKTPLNRGLLPHLEINSNSLYLPRDTQGAHRVLGILRTLSPTREMSLIKENGR